MITVACVNVGDYLSRGDEYVAKLRGQVARNLSQPFRFECLTESDKPGWFAKCDLFQPGLFSGRVLYLDLDSIITGPLDPLVESKGIIDRRDWGWAPGGYCSAVMVWDAGEHEEIHSGFTPDVPGLFRSDQEYITHLGGWPFLPAGLCVSYRYVSKAAPPHGARVVQFHGLPKPHQIMTGWVPKYWKA